MTPHKSLLKKWIPVSSKMITLRLNIRAKIRPAFKSDNLLQDKYIAYYLVEKRHSRHGTMKLS